MMLLRSHCFLCCTFLLLFGFWKVSVPASIATDSSDATLIYQNQAHAICPNLGHVFSSLTRNWRERLDAELYALHDAGVTGGVTLPGVEFDFELLLVDIGR